MNLLSLIDSNSISLSSIILPDLLPHASQWKLLGEALVLFDDDHLDKIYTNNKTDEKCLQNILNFMNE